jgi:hypothetical protein
MTGYTSSIYNFTKEQKKCRLATHILTEKKKPVFQQHKTIRFMVIDYRILICEKFAGAMHARSCHDISLPELKMSTNSL